MSLLSFRLHGRACSGTLLSSPGRFISAVPRTPCFHQGSPGCRLVLAFQGTLVRRMRLRVLFWATIPEIRRSAGLSRRALVRDLSCFLADQFDKVTCGSNIGIGRVLFSFCGEKQNDGARLRLTSLFFKLVTFYDFAQSLRSFECKLLARRLQLICHAVSEEEAGCSIRGDPWQLWG